MIAARFRCVLRGHDEAVTAVFPPAVVLTCDRCGRRRLVELRVHLPVSDPSVAAALVAQVDRATLDELFMSAAVDRAVIDALITGGRL